MNCPFCDSDIIRKQSFFKSKNFFCLYNIRPLFPGHSLLIPKKHIKSFLELKDSTTKEFFKILKKVSKALIKTYKADGINLVIQDGKYARQSIKHFHIHLIPRKKGDIKGNPTDWFLKFISNKERNVSRKEISKNINLIRKNL
jgi:diadenosine tetraphosphate (Ap4A) HIT family hydrolase